MAENAIENLRLLVVSREAMLVRLLWSLGETHSWQVENVGSGWEAMELVQSDSAPNMLVLDLPQGDGDSLHTLRWLRRLRPELPVIVACHPEDAMRQEEAARLGAEAVLVRPLERQHLERVLRDALGSSQENVAADLASHNIESVGEGEYFVSMSPAMQKLRTQAGLLAQADVPVLILGEDGSGKKTVARLIHKLSVRSGFSFQSVNCASLPAPLLEMELFGKANGSARGADIYRISPGKLELAENGTLLLEEITELPADLQSKLLLLLQERQFVRSGEAHTIPCDVRIIATSSANLDHALAEKRLREDLYYRLSAFTVHVPALRHRKEEIRSLLQFSMHEVARHYGLAPKDFTVAMIEALTNHSWPGNLKELETVVKRHLLAGENESVSFAQLHYSGSNRSGAPKSLTSTAVLPGLSSASATLETEPKSLKSLIQSVKNETERNAIAAALEKTRWNRKAAARLLRISYRTLLYKIDQYRMSAPEPYISPFAHNEWKGNGRVS